MIVSFRLGNILVIYTWTITIFLCYVKIFFRYILTKFSILNHLQREHVFPCWWSTSEHDSSIRSVVILSFVRVVDVSGLQFCWQRQRFSRGSWGHWTTQAQTDQSLHKALAPGGKIRYYKWVCCVVVIATVRKTLVLLLHYMWVSILQLNGWK